MAMSGTLTIEQQHLVKMDLCLRSPVTISSNPDRKNLFLTRQRRDPNLDVTTAYENIYMPECKRLFELGMTYPVTLLFIPLVHASHAVSYVQKLFGHKDVRITDDSVLYAVVYSKIDKESLSVILSELKKPNETPSRIRLVFCTSSLGMGFDSPQVSNVIHAKPPYLMSDYFQEIGRAGRVGQPSTATLWYNASDLSRKGVDKSIKQYCKAESECLRNILLSVFGYAKDGQESVSQCCEICLH